MWSLRKKAAPKKVDFEHVCGEVEDDSAQTEGADEAGVEEEPNE